MDEWRCACPRAGCSSVPGPGMGPRARGGAEAVLGVHKHPWGLGFSLLGPVGPFLKQHCRTSVPRGEKATRLRGEPPGAPQTWPFGSLPGPEIASLYLELTVTPGLASMLLLEGLCRPGPLVRGLGFTPPPQHQGGARPANCPRLGSGVVPAQGVLSVQGPWPGMRVDVCLCPPVCARVRARVHV